MSGVLRGRDGAKESRPECSLCSEEYPGIDAERAS